MKRVLILANIPYLFLLFLSFTPLLTASEFIQMTIERPVTEKQRQWGLMQRKTLADNYGMLFSYNYPKNISLWAFNCFTDITVAFIDEKNVIREIKHLKAHPEMMDPKRPVVCLEDIKKYSMQEPICQFFMKKSVVSSCLCVHALEMGTAFFYKSGINVGDVLYIQNSNSAVIIKNKRF